MPWCCSVTLLAAPAYPPAVAARSRCGVPGPACCPATDAITDSTTTSAEKTGRIRSFIRIVSKRRPAGIRRRSGGDRRPEGQLDDAARSAAGRRHLESREGIENAHQRIASDVRGWSL